MLSTHALLKHTDVACRINNEVPYGVCYRSLNIKRPTYTRTTFNLPIASI